MFINSNNNATYKCHPFCKEQPYDKLSSVSYNFRTEAKKELFQKLSKLGLKKLEKLFFENASVYKIKSCVIQYLKNKNPLESINILECFKWHHHSLPSRMFEQGVLEGLLVDSCRYGKEDVFFQIMDTFGMAGKRILHSSSSQFWEAVILSGNEKIIRSLQNEIPVTQSNVDSEYSLINIVTKSLASLIETSSEQQVLAILKTLKKCGVPLAQCHNQYALLSSDPAFKAACRNKVECLKLLVLDYGFNLNKFVNKFEETSIWCVPDIDPKAKDIYIFLKKQGVPLKKNDWRALSKWFYSQYYINGNQETLEIFNKLELPEKILYKSTKMLISTIINSLGASMSSHIDKLLENIMWNKIKDKPLKLLFKKAVLEGESKYIKLFASKLNLKSLPPGLIREVWNGAFASQKIDVVLLLCRLELPIQFGDNDSLLSIATEWQDPERLKAVLLLKFNDRQRQKALKVAFEEGKLEIVMLLAPCSIDPISMLLCRDELATKEMVKQKIQEDSKNFIARSVIPALVSSTVSEAAKIFNYLESLDELSNDTLNTLRVGYKNTHAIAQYPAKQHKWILILMSYSKIGNFASQQWTYAHSIASTFAPIMTSSYKTVIAFFDNANKARFSTAKNTGDDCADSYRHFQTGGLNTSWRFLGYNNYSLRFPHYGTCLPLKNKVINMLHRQQNVPGVKSLNNCNDAYVLTYKGYELTEVHNNRGGGFYRSWSTNWSHPCINKIKKVWSELEYLNNKQQLISKAEVIKDPQKFRKVMLKAYWLCCNMPLTGRGHAQNTWMWFLKQFMDKGLPPPRISQKIGTSDTAAITLPVQIFIKRADEFIDGLPK